MHPSTPNGRVARARGGKCARIGLKRAFTRRVDNYSGITLNRGSSPRGTLRNAHSHNAWEQMRRIVVDCGQIVPWFVPGDRVRLRFFRRKFGRAGAPPPLPLCFPWAVPYRGWGANGCGGVWVSEGTLSSEKYFFWKVAGGLSGGLPPSPC